MSKSKKIVAAVEDLFFVAKINDAAKRSGLQAEFVKADGKVLEHVRQERPLLVIVDLNNGSEHPVELISALKSAPETKSVSVIGFVSHVNGELKQRAHDAGADMVLARSAFSTNLPQILKRHAGSH